MTSAMMSPEEVYVDESEDQSEQERRREYSKIAAENILVLVLNDVLYDPVSELLEYIQQTLALGEALDYMPDSTGLRLAHDFARRVQIAIGGQMAMRLAVQEARR